MDHTYRPPKFAIEMQLSLAGRSNKILKKESVQLMTTGVLENVGLGFFIEPHGNAIYFGHGGADEGFRAEMLVSRDKGYGVAVMVNSDNGQILREVIRGVAKEYGWDEFLPEPYEIISLAPSQLAGLSGRFKVNPDRVLTVKPSGNTLTAYPTGDTPFELLPISDTTFIRRDANIKYQFSRTSATNGDGDYELQLMTPNGPVVTQRLADNMLVPFEMVLAGKTTEAVEAYRKIKKETPQNVSVSEDRLNNLGYALMRQNKLPEAIALLKLNVEFYPNAWNTYDSLAEAYMTAGQKELAIANYKKSLELNPQNSNGREMLKKLEQ
jgi:hypothetical protein